MNFLEPILARWSALPAALRWQGGTLAAGVLMAAVVHAAASGPAVSHATVLHKPAKVPVPSVRHVIRPTPPVDRNLFSLDWNRRPAPSPAATPDDPGFWSDVAKPLKNPRPPGGAR